MGIIEWVKGLFGKPQQEEVADHPQGQVMDLGDDPLDPHGDGTLRPGDPLYEMIMGGGGAVLANRRDDGTWDVKHDHH